MLFEAATLMLYLRQRRFGSPVLLTLLQTAAGINVLAAIGAAGAIASYVAARHSAGWADEALVGFDRALGFDWRQAYWWEIDHPAITFILRRAYGSIGQTPVAVIFALAVTRRFDHLARFLIAFAVTLALTVAIFRFVPAQSALVHLIGTTPPYRPCTDVTQAATIAALRTGKLSIVSLGDMTGIIGFPSFHTAAALLYIYGAWPVTSIRRPVLIVNLTMLAATPVEGAHYLTDVLGGIAVTAAALAVVASVPRGRGACARVAGLFVIRQWRGRPRLPVAAGRQAARRTRSIPAIDTGPALTRSTSTRSLTLASVIRWTD